MSRDDHRAMILPVPVLIARSTIRRAFDVSRFGYRPVDYFFSLSLFFFLCPALLTEFIARHTGVDYSSLPFFSFFLSFFPSRLLTEFVTRYIDRGGPLFLLLSPLLSLLFFRDR